jgi:TIR domain
LADVAEPGNIQGTAEGARAATDPALVFISYSSPDADAATEVCGALERNGQTCWIAPRDVVAGEFYADAIVRAIDAAKVVLLVLSKHAAASPHVVREIERVTSKRCAVVSLRIDLARRR